MKSGSFGNRPVRITNTNGNQIVPFKGEPTGSPQMDGTGAMQQCSKGSCEVSWKPLPTPQQESEDFQP